MRSHRWIILAAVACMSAAAWTAPAQAADAVQLDAQQRQQVLQEAQAAYDRGAALLADKPDEAKAAFATAAQRYQLLIDAGVSNGYLYQNLATASLEAGDVGRAIGNYLEAQRLLGATPELRRDLAYARALRDGVENPREAATQDEGWRTWASDINATVPLRDRARTAAAVWALLWIAGVAAVLWRQRRRVLLRYAMTPALAVTLLLTASVIFSLRQLPAQTLAVVTASDVTLRSGSGETFAPASSGSLKRGEEVQVQREQSGWLEMPAPQVGVTYRLVVR